MRARPVIWTRSRRIGRFSLSMRWSTHMFFEQFPFQDRDEGLLDEFVAICAVYAVLRVLCVCTMANHAERTALADVMAAAFRFINHTASDRYASHMLREIGRADEAGLAELITL